MKKLYFVLFALLFVFGGMAAGALAQDVEPQTVEPQVVEPLAADAPALNPMGTAISYQGQLRNAGGPVNGVCDMTFQLFDALSAGTAITTPIATPVTVTNGLFVTALDFGPAAFNGEARWLEIGVKCAGDAGFMILTPRQTIAPAPYALALPGLRTEQHAFSPNVIGGNISNTVGADVRGAVIAGGGGADAPNVVTGIYSVVGGGYGNKANNSMSIVSGGSGNTANGNVSTVSGGDENTASGNVSTVSGGDENTASGTLSTVSGGQENIASSYASTVSGGAGNTANGGASTVSGGFRNTASGLSAVVGGGSDNVAAGVLSTIPGGYGALASNYGQMAYATKEFTAIGDAQTSVYVLKAEVPTNQTSDELFAGSSRITISNTRTLAFDILIVARSNAGESSGWRYQGVIENNNGTTAFIGTPTKTTLGEDDIVWDVDLIADDANDALVIKGFTNQSGDTVRFVATVRTVEVAW